MSSGAVRNAPIMLNIASIVFHSDNSPRSSNLLKEEKKVLADFKSKTKIYIKNCGNKKINMRLWANGGFSALN